MNFLIPALQFALSFTDLAVLWIGVRLWEASAGKLLPAGAGQTGTGAERLLMPYLDQ